MTNELCPTAASLTDILVLNELRGLFLFFLLTLRSSIIVLFLPLSPVFFFLGVCSDIAALNRNCLLLQLFPAVQYRSAFRF